MTPQTFNGYYKYLVRTGDFESAPGFITGIYAQDILAKSYKEANYLLTLLYEQLPELCLVVQEIDEQYDIPASLNYDLVNPN